MVRTERIRRLPWDDRGTSLAELLVVIAISSVLLIAVGTTFTSSLKVTQAVSARTGATTDAKLAMDTAARRLRVAIRPAAGGVAIVSASATGVKFYSSYSPVGTTTAVNPTLVEYAIDPGNGCFREYLTPATVTVTGGVSNLTWPVSTRKSRCLVFGRVDASGGGVFSYYAAPGDVTPLPLVAGVLPGASLDRVRSVQLTMSVKDRSSSDANPTQVQTRVGLFNRLTEDQNGSR